MGKLLIILQIMFCGLSTAWAQSSRSIYISPNLKTNAAKYKFNSIQDMKSALGERPCLRGGDKVLLQKGYTYRGSLSFVACRDSGRDKIWIRSYGTGKAPIINSSDTLASLTSADFEKVSAVNVNGKRTQLNGKDIYRIKLPEVSADMNSVVNQLVFTGGGKIQQLALARSPNTSSLQRYDGHYEIEEVINEQRLVAVEDAFSFVNEFGYSDDIRFIMRQTNYTYNEIPVSNIVNNRVVMMGKKVHDEMGRQHRGYGFFMSNSIAFLDKPGEWYFDKDTRYLYMIATDRRKPNKNRLEVNFKLTDAGGVDRTPSNINLSAGSDFHFNVYVNGLELRNSASSGVKFASGLNTSKNKRLFVNRIYVNRPAEYGVFVHSAQDVSVSNSKFHHVPANGIHLTRIHKVARVANNKFWRVGSLQNQTHLVGNFNAIYVARYITAYIVDNQIREVGSNGITAHTPYKSIVPEVPGGGTLFLSRNTIDTFCLMIHDCVAIALNPGYAQRDKNLEGSQLVTHNRIVNGIGNYNGTRIPSRKVWLAAIRVDHNGENYIVADNLIDSITDSALKGLIIFHGGITNRASRNYDSQGNLIESVITPYLKATD